MEELSDASFLGNNLVLPANVRRLESDCQVQNTLAYLALPSATKKKVL
jgi:hypothetical protein